jgi:hypothetical protein
MTTRDERIWAMAGRMYRACRRFLDELDPEDEEILSHEILSIVLEVEDDGAFPAPFDEFPPRLPWNDFLDRMEADEAWKRALDE